jgi:hypothetical protein
MHKSAAPREALIVLREAASSRRALAFIEE